MIAPLEILRSRIRRAGQRVFRLGAGRLPASLARADAPLLNSEDIAELAVLAARLASARGRYGWAGPDWTDWFYKPGGGALFDLGVYNLTTLTGWLGPVRRVTAMTGVTSPERIVNGQTVRVESDDNTQVLLDFGGNCFASITTGFNLQQYRGPAIELFGTEGTVNLLGDDWDPDGYELWQNSAGCWQLCKETKPEWPWTDGLRHLVECLQNGASPLPTPEHAFHVLEVMLQAQAAGRDGRTRAVESVFTPPAPADAGPAAAAHRVHDRTREEPPAGKG